MARSSDPAKRAMWQRRLQRFADSGVSVARFCAAEEVSASSFYYWQKKLRSRKRLRAMRAEDHATRCVDSPAPRGDRGGDAEERGVFRPVTVVPATPGVVVRLPGGTRIEVAAGQLDAIRAVVAETVRSDRDRAAEPAVPSDRRLIRKRGASASC